MVPYQLFFAGQLLLVSLKWQQMVFITINTAIKSINNARKKLRASLWKLLRTCGYDERQKSVCAFLHKNKSLPCSQARTNIKLQVKRPIYLSQFACCIHMVAGILFTWCFSKSRKRPGSYWLKRTIFNWFVLEKGNINNSISFFVLQRNVSGQVKKKCILQHGLYKWALKNRI